MSKKFKLPNKRAAIFWPVGTGDSTTLVIESNKIVAQIDLRHLTKADNPDEPEWAIIDELVRILPKKADGHPYLALFILTHPDKDHILGFDELRKRVDIGEIWHTPKIFRDQSDQETLCDDAKAFRKEVHRRREAILKNPDYVKSGDRLRIIGHDDVLNDDKYKKIPTQYKSRPGEIVRQIDGTDRKDFAAFIHAPFSDDQAKDRNNTSLALNIALWEGGKCGQFFFWGDREYPTIKRIFETTEEASQNQSGTKNTVYLYWDVMLSAHHCSKCVMYWKDENDEKEVLKNDIMKLFEKYSRNDAGYIVASAHSDFTDEEGKNPPHKRARDAYEGIVQAGHFICTHEHPNKKTPEPIVFTVEADGVKFDDKRTKTSGTTVLTNAIPLAFGGAQPPGVQIGFGSCSK
jgi:beta-lactamase superfamily II metal-dependent hydrolase